MNLIMVTPRVGVGDPLLAFIPTWVTHLTRRVGKLWVITPRAEPIPLPDNVEVYEVGRDYNQGETVLHALRNFHRVMRRLTRDEHVDGIFTHMFPKFAILAAPYAKMRHVPLVMWYTHTHVSWQLRLAEKMVDRIATASPGSCRLRSDKVVILGHGIDTDRFSPLLPRPARQCPVILSVGRISPKKHYEVLIEAAGKIFGQYGLDNFRLRLIGQPPRSDQPAYFEELKQMVSDVGLANHVSFEGVIPYDQIATVYQQADVFVSASQTGLDKAVLEAMACGLIPVVSLTEFAHTLESYADLLMYEPGNASALADRLRRVLAMAPGERERLGDEMRKLIKEKHEVGMLVSRLVAIFEECAERN